MRFLFCVSKAVVSKYSFNACLKGPMGLIYLLCSTVSSSFTKEILIDQLIIQLSYFFLHWGLRDLHL